MCSLPLPCAFQLTASGLLSQNHTCLCSSVSTSISLPLLPHLLLPMVPFHQFQRHRKHAVGMESRSGQVRRHPASSLTPLPCRVIPSTLPLKQEENRDRESSYQPHNRNQISSNFYLPSGLRCQNVCLLDLRVNFHDLNCTQLGIKCDLNQ